jgi:hypothetical protein
MVDFTDSSSNLNSMRNLHISDDEHSDNEDAAAAVPPTAAQVEPTSAAEVPVAQRISFGPNQYHSDRRVSDSAKDDDSIDSEYSHEEKPAGSYFKYKASTSDMKQRKPAAASSKEAHAAVPASALKTSSRLTKVSNMYDLDGDGILDETEQAMRDRDLSGRGFLTNQEIYKIVQEQLDQKDDVKMYKRMTIGLVGFVFLLALSNFGTSFATAMLSKETSTDATSAEVHFKGTNEIVGYDTAATTFEFTELSETEYQERRALVLSEMNEDMDHEDHRHRKLGNEKNACSCSQIAFDQGKVREKDLIVMVDKCDGINTINVKRKWKNSDGSYDIDYDTLCGPGVTIVKKNKKKDNKRKTKTRVVTQQIVFKKGPRKNMKKEDKNLDVAFDCKQGWW